MTFVRGVLALVACSTVGPAQSVVRTVPGAAPLEGFGRTLCSIGDVDGDGLGDFAAAAVTADGASPGCGSVRAVSGQSGGTIWIAYGSATDDNFGWALALAADFDGDGAGDVLASAPQTGIPNLRGYVRALSGRTGATLFEVAGLAARDEFGISVCALPDVTGDGIADFAVGAWISDAGGADSGAVHVISGADRAFVRTIPGLAADDRFGISVRSLDDVDGDGLDDLAIGAHGSDASASNAGSAFVVSTSSGSILRSFHGLATDDHFGFALTVAGDVDGDGALDLAIGARNARNTAGVAVGSVRVHSVASGALLRELFGASDGGLFGYNLDGGADVDLDGVKDLVIGAVFDSTSAFHAGSASVFSGASGARLYTVHGEDAGDGFGRDAAFVEDLSGDGAADVLLGAYRDEIAGTSSGSVRVLRGYDLGPAPYCTAKVNSRGCMPTIQWSGGTSLSGPDDLVARASSVLSSQFGMFFFGRAPTATPWLGGTLCVRSPLERTPIQLATGSPPPSDCTGTYALALTHAWLQARGFAPGTTLYGQWFSRDPGFAPPGNVGLTDAIAITVRP